MRQTYCSSPKQIALNAPQIFSQLQLTLEIDQRTELYARLWWRTLIDWVLWIDWAFESHEFWRPLSRVDWAKPAQHLWRTHEMGDYLFVNEFNFRPTTLVNDPIFIILYCLTIALLSKVSGMSQNSNWFLFEFFRTSLIFPTGQLSPFPILKKLEPFFLERCFFPRHFYSNLGWPWHFPDSPHNFFDPWRSRISLVSTSCASSAFPSGFTIKHESPWEVRGPLV